MRDDLLTDCREQLRAAAAAVGDDPKDIDCYYHPYDEEQPWSYDEENRPVVRCRGDELPTRKYDAGFGGVEGEPVVGFSERFVYVRVGYDGAEHIAIVPRLPDALGKNIPHYYGGG